MKFPRYWAKVESDLTVHNPGTGAPMKFSCWGWSDVSRPEAEEKGRGRAKAVEEKLRQGQRPDRYLYGDQPMREEVQEEWKNAEGAVYAAVTLNAYGCQVLNTTNIMFVDVDLPEASKSLAQSLKRLFGGAPSPSQGDRERPAMEKIEAMVQMDPKCGVRVYRTRAGLRYLLTHSHAKPSDQATLKAMEVLGADPLYVKLCRMQECFRARLTPKPWRCGVSALNVRYPWAEKRVEQMVRNWCDSYRRKADRYATCALVNHLGSTNMDAEIARVVEYHDRLTKAGSGLELA